MGKLAGKILVGYVLLDVVHESDVDDAEAVDELLHLLMQKEGLHLLVDGFGLVEDAIGVGEGLLDLVHGVLLLDVLQCILQVEGLQLDKVVNLLLLV